MSRESIGPMLDDRFWSILGAVDGSGPQGVSPARIAAIVATPAETVLDALEVLAEFGLVEECICPGCGSHMWRAMWFADRQHEGGTR